MINDLTPMEAAHIVPLSKRGANITSNGLCLCPIHHWAFDRGLWSLDKFLVIKIASTIRNNTNEQANWLDGFHDKKAIFTLKPRISIEALDWYRRNIFSDADDEIAPS